MSQRLNTFLSQHQGFNRLAHKARELMLMQKIWDSIVPPSLARSSQVLNYESQTLIIRTANGAVATKLRHMTTELVEQLHLKGVEVTLIQFQVQVAHPITPPTSHKRAISKQGKQALGNFTEKLGASPLKDALNRLLQK